MEVTIPLAFGFDANNTRLFHSYLYLYLSSEFKAMKMILISSLSMTTSFQQTMRMLSVSSRSTYYLKHFLLIMLAAILMTCQWPFSPNICLVLLWVDVVHCTALPQPHPRFEEHSTRVRKRYWVLGTWCLSLTASTLKVFCPRVSPSPTILGSCF